MNLAKAIKNLAFFLFPLDNALILAYNEGTKGKVVFKMTVKEYNKIRAAVFQAALENSAEVEEAIRVEGVAYIYDVQALPDKHVVLVLTHQAQLNDNVLRKLGFDNPEAATARLVMTLNRQTKCATF